MSNLKMFQNKTGKKKMSNNRYFYDVPLQKSIRNKIKF